MNEKLRIDAWLVAYLESDTALAALVTGVYSEVIPRNRALPAIRFHAQSQKDVVIVGAKRIVTDVTYLVAAVTEGEAVGPGVAIADRMDVLLHRDQTNPLTNTEQLLVAGIRVLTTTRLQTYTFFEEVAGEQFRHAGGFFRVQAQPQ